MKKYKFINKKINKYLIKIRKFFNNQNNFIIKKIEYKWLEVIV